MAILDKGARVRSYSRNSPLTPRKSMDCRNSFPGDSLQLGLLLQWELAFNRSTFDLKHFSFLS